MSTTPDVIRPVIMGQRPIIVGQQVRDMLGQLHDLYGRDQPLSQHLAGLNVRLAQARLLYGPNRSISAVVSGLYGKLDELRRLYGYDSIEEILDLTIDLKKRLDRMAVKGGAKRPRAKGIPGTKAAIQAIPGRFGETESAISRHPRQQRDSKKRSADIKRSLL